MPLRVAAGDLPTALLQKDRIKVISSVNLAARASHLWRAPPEIDVLGPLGRLAGSDVFPAV